MGGSQPVDGCTNGWPASVTDQFSAIPPAVDIVRRVQKEAFHFRAETEELLHREREGVAGLVDFRMAKRALSARRIVSPDRRDRRLGADHNRISVATGF